MRIWWDIPSELVGSTGLLRECSDLEREERNGSVVATRGPLFQSVFPFPSMSTRQQPPWEVPKGSFRTGA